MGPLLSEQVCFALYSTTGEITKAYRDLLEPHGLTYPQFVVMMALWHDNGASLTDTAKSVGLSKSTLTPMLKKLERLGYIERQFVVGNERTKSMQLTEQGEKFAKEGGKIAKLALCATGLSEEEAKTLIQLCFNIKENLG